MDAANGYVLTLSLLVAAYVRHLEDADYEKQQADASAASSFAAADHDRSLLERKTVVRASVTVLAQFLLDELQRPHDALRATTTAATDATQGEHGDATKLHALFSRLHYALRARPEDATVLSDEVLHVLAGLDSPDAVGDVVDAISECVTPFRPQSGDDDGASDAAAADALLVRTSVFGVFVRRVVLAVNRLLFDGLSRLFDEVTRYRDEYADMQAAMRRTSGGGGASASAASTRTGAATGDEISLSLTSSPSMRFLWRHGDELDDLPLSPIVGASQTRRDAEASQFLSLSLLDDQDDDATDRTTKHEIDAGSPATSNELSRDQTQYFVHDVVEELQQGLTLSSDVASTGRVLRPLQKALDPDALFVKYLDAVNCREYDSALEALHQYHDVALSRTQRFRHALRARSKATAAAVSGADPAVTSAAASAGPSLHFLGSGVQYAALNLAGLHIAFDRFSAAQDSIQEAIRVAQHHGDHICVAFALSWLVRVQLVQGKPRHQVAALIASALERAEELSIPSLRALVSLTALEYDSTLGGSASSASAPSHAGLAAVAQFPAPRPLDLWSRFNEVDQLLHELSESIGASAASGAGNSARTLGNLVNMQQQQQLQQSGAGGTARSDGKKTTGMSWMQSVEAVLHTMWSLQGKSRAAAAIGWQLYGARALSDSLDNVVWTSYKQSASSREVASWISRMVFSRVEWSAVVEDEEDQGREDSAAGRIQFVGAFQLMLEILRQPDVQRLQLLLRDKILQRTIHHVLALWSMHRGEFALAEAYISSLLALSSSASDVPSRVEALVLQSRLWGETGDYLQCFDQLDELDAVCRDRGFEYLRVQVLILKSEYTRRSRLPHSPFDAMPAVLEAIKICLANRYDLLLAEAHLVIAEIYIAMGKLQDASQLLDQQMPLVMEHGSIQLRAESLLVLAKAMLATTSGGPASPSGGPLAVDDQVVEWLDDSAALYARLESWRKLREIAFLKTTLLHRNGRAATTEAANEFLHFERLLRTAQQKQRETLPVAGVDSISVLTKIVQDRRLVLEA